MALPTKIEVRGAKVHNLKNIDVDIPLHKFVAISGLSGSGKSSLAMGILYEEGSRRYLDALSTYMRRRIKQGTQADVTSVKHIPSALALRQRPSVPNERATVGTTTETFNVLRLIFSRLGSPVCPNGHRVTSSLEIAEAAAKFGAEMGMITCPTCHGERYNSKIQQVKWHNLSIVDVLNLDINEALPVFKRVPKIERELELLKEVGLDYLHLGESTPTLSGGEAQRLKLVIHLSHKQDDTLFVFDEPTIGLHPLDVKVLVQVMQKLLDQGATIITITHDLNLIVNADYMLDLGPRGGENGGRVVAEGKPADLIKKPESLTVKYLADYWKQFK